jgi:hypothetical protein
LSYNWKFVKCQHACNSCFESIDVVDENCQPEGNDSLDWCVVWIESLCPAVLFHNLLSHWVTGIAGQTMILEAVSWNHGNNSKQVVARGENPDCQENGSTRHKANACNQNRGTAAMTWGRILNAIRNWCAIWLKSSNREAYVSLFHWTHETKVFPTSSGGGAQHIFHRFAIHVRKRALVKSRNRLIANTSKWE